MSIEPRPLDERIKVSLSGLEKLAPGYTEGLVVFLVDRPVPRLLMFSSEKEELRCVGAEPLPVASTSAAHRLVAAEAASLHAPLIADVEIDGSSILAIPVLAPEIYQPSPMMRPVIGVVSFATRTTAADLIRNPRFQETAERLASSLVLHARAGEGLPGRPLTQLDEVVVPSNEWVGDEPYSVPIEDGLGRNWYGFRPGRFAVGSALEEFRTVQSRLNESADYLRTMKIQTPENL